MTSSWPHPPPPGPAAALPLDRNQEKPEHFVRFVAWYISERYKIPPDWGNRDERGKGVGAECKSAAPPLVREHPGGGTGRRFGGRATAVPRNAARAQGADGHARRRARAKAGMQGHVTRAGRAHLVSSEHSRFSASSAWRRAPRSSRERSVRDFARDLGHLDRTASDAPRRAKKTSFMLPPHGHRQPHTESASWRQRRVGWLRNGGAKSDGGQGGVGDGSFEGGNRNGSIGCGDGCGDSGDDLPVRWAATVNARAVDAAPGAAAAAVSARAVAEAADRAAGRAAGRATAERVAVAMAAARMKGGIGDGDGNKESGVGDRTGAVGGNDCSAGMVYAATADGVRARVLRRLQCACGQRRQQKHAAKGCLNASRVSLALSRPCHESATAKLAKAALIELAL